MLFIDGVCGMRKNRRSGGHSCHDTCRGAHNESGMTLFELLVVLAIIAFLAAIAAPRVVGYLGRAKVDVAASQAANIAASLELFFLDHARYPTQQEGLEVLVRSPDTDSDWRGPYLKNPDGLIDPWGRPYLYAVNTDTEGFVVRTFGRDGEPGGEDEDGDIEKR